MLRAAGNINYIYIYICAGGGVGGGAVEDFTTRVCKEIMRVHYTHYANYVQV